MISRQQQIKKLFKAIGKEEIMAKRDCLDTALHNAASRGIPPSWQFDLDDLAKSKGIVIPRELFSNQQGKAA